MQTEQAVEVVILFICIRIICTIDYLSVITNDIFNILLRTKGRSHWLDNTRLGLRKKSFLHANFQQQIITSCSWEQYLVSI